MQGIYTYIPETNYVPREYSVAAILLLLFKVLISLDSVFNLLYFYISTFRSMCGVPNMAVFCSSLTSCFPGMLLTYLLNDFEIVPIAPIITGITFVFTFHMSCISIVRSLCFRIFSACFLITFLSPEIATSINIHVPFSLSRIIIIKVRLFDVIYEHGDGAKSCEVGVVDLTSCIDILCHCSTKLQVGMAAISQYFTVIFRISSMSHVTEIRLLGWPMWRHSSNC